MERGGAVKVIKGPIVSVNRLLHDWAHPIIYSVQLENGWIATSPSTFPSVTPEQSDQSSQEDKPQ